MKIRFEAPLNSKEAARLLCPLLRHIESINPVGIMVNEKDIDYIATMTHVLDEYREALERQPAK